MFRRNSEALTLAARKRLLLLVIAVASSLPSTSGARARDYFSPIHAAGNYVDDFGLRAGKAIAHPLSLRAENYGDDLVRRLTAATERRFCQAAMPASGADAARDAGIYRATLLPGDAGTPIHMEEGRELMLRERRKIPAVHAAELRAKSQSEQVIEKIGRRGIETQEDLLMVFKHRHIWEDKKSDQSADVQLRAYVKRRAEEEETKTRAAEQPKAKAGMATTVASLFRRFKAK